LFEREEEEEEAEEDLHQSLQFIHRSLIEALPRLSLQIDVIASVLLYFIAELNDRKTETYSINHRAEQQQYCLQ